MYSELKVTSQIYCYLTKHSNPSEEFYSTTMHQTALTQWFEHSCNGRLATGRMSLLSFICTLETQTALSGPGNVSTIHPSGHFDDFKFSHGKTRPPKFMLKDNYFFCSVNIGRYSRVHWDQNILVAAWTAFHVSHNITSTSLLLTTRLLLDRHPDKKWFGISAL